MARKKIPKWMFDSSTSKCIMQAVHSYPHTSLNVFGSFGFDKEGYFISKTNLFTTEETVYLKWHFQDWPHRTETEDALFEIEFGVHILSMLQKIADQSWDVVC